MTMMSRSAIAVEMVMSGTETSDSTIHRSIRQGRMDRTPITADCVSVTNAKAHYRNA